jgi:hypothetical protein
MLRSFSGKSIFWGVLVMLTLGSALRVQGQKIYLLTGFNPQVIRNDDGTLNHFGPAMRDTAAELQGNFAVMPTRASSYTEKRTPGLIRKKQSRRENGYSEQDVLHALQTCPANANDTLVFWWGAMGRPIRTGFRPSSTTGCQPVLGRNTRRFGML